MIVTFAIGNSDDKLSQADWSGLLGDVHTAADQAVIDGAHVHFMGYSAPGAPWQNALWAIDLGVHAEVVRGALRVQLAELAGRYRQDSIAWWEAGHAEMIPPAVVPR